MPDTAVFRVPTRAPHDVAGLARLLDDGVFAASDVLAAIGKTEGNGGTNDFTKDFAIAAIRTELARRGADPTQPGGIRYVLARLTSGISLPSMWFGGANTIRNGLFPEPDEELSPLHVAFEPHDFG